MINKDTLYFFNFIGLSKEIGEESLTEKNTTNKVEDIEEKVNPIEEGMLILSPINCVSIMHLIESEMNYF